MITWVTKKLWPYVAIGFLLILFIFSTRRNGALSEKIKKVENVNATQKRMREARANTRTDRQSVIKRLHDGAF